jgi:molecular chaperone DnaK (HSP70)
MKLWLWEQQSRGDILRPGEGKKDGAVLLNVIPLSLGLETIGGVFASLIERNYTSANQKISSVFENTSKLRFIRVKERCAGEISYWVNSRWPKGVPKLDCVV